MIASKPKIDVKTLSSMSPRERKAAEALVRRGLAVYVDEPIIKEATDPKWKQAAGHLTDFMEATSPWQMEDWQDIINDRLTKMVKEKQTGQRLMLHAPPQNGKSIITSQRFPAFVIGHDPATRVRLACYNETHAEAFGEVIQNIMQTEEYRLIFPDPRLTIPDKSAKGRWSTAARADVADAQPSFLAMGLNTGFVGQGADWLIIDDPYKNREEAFSKVINERIWRFWSVTGKQRITPETNVLVIFHRWARNDLAGRLMDEGGWEVMRFPALCDGRVDDPTFVEGRRQFGDALTPRRPKYFLLELKEKDPITFSALQQGDPLPEGGQQFMMDLLKEHDIYPDAPSLPLLALYQGVDLAISLKQTADYTAVATIGVDNEQNIYILGLNFERVGFHGAMEKIESEAALWGGKKGSAIISISIETTAYQLAAFEEASLRYMLPFSEVKPKKDKLTRASLFMSRVARGKVYVNKRAPWWPELESQMIGIADDTVKDDLVDAIVNALEGLPVASIEEKEKLPSPYWSMERLIEEMEAAEEEAARRELN